MQSDVPCPQCGTPMIEGLKRIRAQHFLGKTRKEKTKVCRVFTCPRCECSYAPMLRLVKVEIVDKPLNVR